MNGSKLLIKDIEKHIYNLNLIYNDFYKQFIIKTENNIKNVIE